MQVAEWVLWELQSRELDSSLLIIDGWLFGVVWWISFRSLHNKYLHKLNREKNHITKVFLKVVHQATPVKLCNSSKVQQLAINSNSSTLNSRNISIPIDFSKSLFSLNYVTFIKSQFTEIFNNFRFKNTLFINICSSYDAFERQTSSLHGENPSFLIVKIFSSHYYITTARRKFPHFNWFCNESFFLFTFPLLIARQLNRNWRWCEMCL